MFETCYSEKIFQNVVSTGWLAGVISSAAYKKWERAAIAGVSLVADAAEHLERTTSDKEVEHDPGIPGGFLVVVSYCIYWKDLNSGSLRFDTMIFFHSGFQAKRILILLALFCLHCRLFHTICLLITICCLLWNSSSSCSQLMMVLGGPWKWWEQMIKSTQTIGFRSWIFHT